MLASSSRVSFKRVHSIYTTAAHTIELSAALSSTHWQRSHASSSLQQQQKPQSESSNAASSSSSSTPRTLPGFQGDTDIQKAMTRTTKARLTMQLMVDAQKGYYNRCLDIASEMKTRGVKPDLATYTALMTSAAHTGAWLDAFAILDDMLSVGVNPDVGILNMLVKAQFEMNSQYMFAALDKMKELKITPNATTFSLITERYIRHDNFELAVQYFYAMKSLNVKPDVTCAESVISMTAECGYPRLAIDLATWFEKNSDRRLDPATWTKCLISSAEALYADGVVQCWNMVVGEYKMNPGEGVSMAVLHTAGRNGLPDLATDALRVLKASGLSWEEYHFAPLIEAFCRKKQVKEALQALQIMRAHEVEPLPETAYPLLDIMQNTNAVDATWAIIDELQKNGKQIDLTVLQALIKASVDLKDLQRAIGAYKSLSEYGVSADLTIFNLLIKGCAFARHRELGNLLLADMKEAKIKPDQETYENFISLCLSQDDYEDAFFYLEEMKACGFVPPHSVYEALVFKCLEAKDPRHTIALEEMKEKGHSPSPVLRRKLQEAGSGGREKKDRDVIASEPLAIEGAAQRFIESGGLEGVQELPKELLG